MGFLKKKGEVLFAILVVLAILGLVIVITIGNIMGKEIKMANFINKLPGVFSGTLSSLNYSLYELSRGGYTNGTSTIPFSFFGTDPYNPIAYFNIPQVAPIYGVEVEYQKKGFFGSYNPFTQLNLNFEFSATTASGTIRSLQLQPK
ncbi:MAG: hypothetical protein ACP5JU_00270 [Minisyncoccia bacterium]